MTLYLPRDTLRTFEAEQFEKRAKERTADAWGQNALKQAQARISQAARLRRETPAPFQTMLTPQRPGQPEVGLTQRPTTRTPVLQPQRPQPEYGLTRRREEQPDPRQEESALWAAQALDRVKNLLGEAKDTAGEKISQGAEAIQTTLGGGGEPGVLKWADLIQKNAEKYGVPANIIAGLMEIESSGNPEAQSPMNYDARGNPIGRAQSLMQVMPFHFREGENPMDPETNMRVAIERVLKPAYDRLGDWTKAAAAYFGAIDAQGNITGASDVTGTSGNEYVRRFQEAASKYTNLAAMGGQAPVDTEGSPLARAAGYVFPVEGYTGEIDLHHGAQEGTGGSDIFAAEGTPVKVMRGGTVTSAGYTDIGGNFVMIEGDDGNQYYYAHMDRTPAVETGQKIGAGAYLGGVGETGNAKGTGAHLHLGVGPSIVTGTGPMGGTGGSFDAVGLLRSVLGGETVENPSPSVAARPPNPMPRVSPLLERPEPLEFRRRTPMEPVAPRERRPLIAGMGLDAEALRSGVDTLGRMAGETAETVTERGGVILGGVARGAQVFGEEVGRQAGLAGRELARFATDLGQETSELLAERMEPETARRLSRAEAAVADPERARMNRLAGISPLDLEITREGTEPFRSPGYLQPASYEEQRSPYDMTPEEAEGPLAGLARLPEGVGGAVEDAAAMTRGGSAASSRDQFRETLAEPFDADEYSSRAPLAPVAEAGTELGRAFVPPIGQSSEEAMRRTETLENLRGLVETPGRMIGDVIRGAAEPVGEALEPFGRLREEMLPSPLELSMMSPRELRKFLDTEDDPTGVNFWEMGEQAARTQLGATGTPTEREVARSARDAYLAFGVAGSDVSRVAKNVPRALASDPAYQKTARMYESPPVEEGARSSLWRGFVRRATDRSIDLKHFQEQAQKNLGRPLRADEMAYELSRLNADSAAAVRVQKSLGPAVQSVGRDYNLLTQYLTHQNNLDIARATGNADRVFPGGIRAADSQRVIETMQGELAPQRLAKIEQAADEIWGFGRSLLERKRDSGLISGDLYQELTRRYPHYVPTKILDYLADTEARFPGRKLSVNDTGLKRLTAEGTSKEREDPIASLVRLAYQTETLTRKNDAARAFIRLREAHPEGELIEELVGETANRTAGRNFEKISVFEDGARHVYRMPKHLAEAVKMESTAQVPGVSTIMNIARMGMTSRNPVFLASNSIMDASTFAVRASLREGGPQHLPRVMVELTKAYVDTFKGLTRGQFAGEMTQRYLEGGGGMFGFFSQNQRGVAEATRHLRRNGVVLDNAEDAMKMVRDLATFKPIQEIGERIELAPRVAQMRLAEKRGANAVESVIQGRTVTIDFAQGGTWSKFINQFVPFFNVGIQSGAQIPRAFRENPKAFVGTVGATLVGPTVAAESWNRSDPQRSRDYEDVPQYLKDAGIVLMLPVDPQESVTGERQPQYLYIPTREFSPFVVATREAAGRVLGEDPREWASLLQGAAQSVLPAETAFDFVPVGLSTGVQLQANEDFFRGRNVVSKWTESEATDTAHAIANLIEEAARAAGDEQAQVSGAAVEFAVRDYLGGGGGAALAAGDLIGALASGEGIERRDDRIQSLPGIGGLVGRFVRDSGGELFYRARDERVSDEAARVLREHNLDINITPVSDTIKGLPLSRAQQTKYQSTVNIIVNDLLPMVAETPAWQAAPREGKEKVVRELVSRAREAGQAVVLPDLAEEGESERLMKRMVEEIRREERARR
ncbi:MAG: peptidoglycan DD-metalloendopeptidase family protein [Actinobacteria bacterium]|nr:peptidoglycan DD-metalloendopeptidase family protein [Actinomycetota bacterium]